MELTTQHFIALLPLLAERVIGLRQGRIVFDLPQAQLDDVQLAVVAQHGYQPNANAKHLKQQVPEGLALIVKGTQNALFADLLDKLQPCLEARGYTPTVY